MRAARTPRDGPDPRHELAQAERLDEVVVGSELEADDAVDLLAARRDDDDRHVAARPQLTADGEAVDVRQPEVEQHEVGRLCGEGIRPGRDADDVEPLAPQALGERHGDRIVVLDEQDVHHRRIVAAGSRDRPPWFTESLPSLGLRLSRALPGASYRAAA